MPWMHWLLSIAALVPVMMVSTPPTSTSVPDALIPAGPVPPNVTVEPGYVPGQLVVKLLPDAVSAQADHPQAEPGAAFSAVASLNSLNSQYQVAGVNNALAIAATDETAKQQGLDRIFILEVPSDTDVWEMAAAYSSDPNVEYAEPSVILALREPPTTEELITEALSTEDPATAAASDLIFPNDPYFIEQDNLYNTGQSGGSTGADVNAASAWELQTGSVSVTIAVIDTGINPAHPDLEGKVLTDLAYDFVEDDRVPQDTTNHGTRVAGVIAANTNNGVGMAGMCWLCQLLPLRVGTSVIHFASVEVAEAIYYAATLPVDVINMSLGGQCSELWADVVNYAYARNVVLVAAAGNVVDFVSYPARFDQVIAVSAVNHNDQFASFSSSGPEVDVAAPGADILVTDVLGEISLGSGTSYASAVTAGIVGLLRSANPDLTNSEIRQILRNSAVDLGEPGFDVRYGFGRVNARLALEQALDPPLLAPVPTSDRCGCVLGDLSSASAAEAALQQPSAVSTLSTTEVLYSVRDEILATSPFGQEITTLYYRHSPQVANLVFQDAELQTMMQAALATGIPYALSVLTGDGEQVIDPQDVDEADALVAKLATTANPELRSDLLRVWQAMDLADFADQPVRAVVEHLSQMPTPHNDNQILLPLISSS